MVNLNRTRYTVMPNGIPTAEPTDESVEQDGAIAVTVSPSAGNLTIVGETVLVRSAARVACAGPTTLLPIGLSSREVSQRRPSRRIREPVEI